MRGASLKSICSALTAMFAYVCPAAQPLPMTRVPSSKSLYGALARLPSGAHFGAPRELSAFRPQSLSRDRDKSSSEQAAPSLLTTPVEETDVTRSVEYPLTTSSRRFLDQLKAQVLEGDQLISARVRRLGDDLPILDAQDWQHFRSIRFPRISLERFLYRFQQSNLIQQETLIVALVYLARAQEQGCAVNSMTIHRLMLISLVLASKYLDDIHLNNKDWADLAGVTLLELNKLERIFCNRIEFRLSVSDDAFEEASRPFLLAP